MVIAADYPFLNILGSMILFFSYRWAAPVAVALRRSGGQLVASGRIPVQAVLASLDATEANV